MSLYLMGDFSSPQQLHNHIGEKENHPKLLISSYTAIPYHVSHDRETKPAGDIDTDIDLCVYVLSCV